MLPGGQERSSKATDRYTKRGGLPVAGACDDGWERDSVASGQRLQGVSCDDFLDRFRVSIEERNRRPRGMAKPVAPRRRDAEDLRSGPVVRHGFLFDRVDVARDDPPVHVQPELALVNAANAAQTDLALADLAIAGTRRAHDLVRALDRLPELGDFPHRLAWRLPDIEDFRFRNHRPSVHWSHRVKTLCEWAIESRKNGSVPSPSLGAAPSRFSSRGCCRRMPRPSRSS